MDRTSSFRAVLLDVDGTLLDTNDLHAEAWQRALNEHGHDVPFERVRALIGMGGDKLLPELTGLSEDDDEAKPLLELRRLIFFQDCVPRIRALPRARELLLCMRERGLRLVTASSASREELKVLLARGGLDDLMQDTTSSDDAEHSKPDPDIVRAALRKAECAPSQACMLGDTPYDVEAATRAGVPIIALRSGGWDDTRLHGALAIYDGPADLLQHYGSSALAR